MIRQERLRSLNKIVYVTLPIFVKLSMICSVSYVSPDGHSLLDQTIVDSLRRQSLTERGEIVS